MTVTGQYKRAEKYTNIELNVIYSVTQISSSTNRHPYGRHSVAQKVLQIYKLVRLPLGQSR